MAAKKKQQTHAKRARELAVKERRERKRAKKAEASAERASGDAEAAGNGIPETEGHADTPTADRVQ